MTGSPVSSTAATVPVLRGDAPARVLRAAPALAEYVASRIRTIHDWPRAGVEFRDITSLLADAAALRVVVDAFTARYASQQIDFVAGLEARGFIFAAALACRLEAGLIPIRKQGKLPGRTIAEDYELEYGSARLEVHADACSAGQRVLLVDDLIATGGTMLAGRRLLERLGAVPVEAATVVDLPDLGGSQRLAAAGLPVFALCAFGGH